MGLKLSLAQDRLPKIEPKILHNKYNSVSDLETDPKLKADKNRAEMLRDSIESKYERMSEIA